jgi:hypothetical protein
MQRRTAYATWRSVSPSWSPPRLNVADTSSDNVPCSIMESPGPSPVPAPVASMPKAPEPWDHQVYREARDIRGIASCTRALLFAGSLNVMASACGTEVSPQRAGVEVGAPAIHAAVTILHATSTAMLR